MRYIFITAATFLALTWGGGRQADAAEPHEQSYTYLSLEWEHSNVHEGSRSLTYGFCFEFADPFHIFGGWQEGELDLGSLSLDGMTVTPEASREAYLVGLGIKQRVGKGKMIQFRAGYLDSKTEIRVPIPDIPFAPPTIVEGDGYYFEVGIRTVFLPKWELHTFVAYYHLGGAVSQTSQMSFTTLEHRVAESLGLSVSPKFIFGDGKSESLIFATRYYFNF